MSAFPVYVVAPYERAPEVRELHAELHALGCLPVSHWARLARGLDLCAEMSPGEKLSAIELNDRCIEQAAAVVVLSYEREGGEMFCEVERARVAGIPVLWTGDRYVLTCARSGIYVCTRERAMVALSVSVRHYQSSVYTARVRLHRLLRDEGHRWAS